MTAAVFLAAACALSASCSDDSEEPNQPPTVWLSGNPPEGSTTSYKIEMLWGGYDPDGEVAYFEYVVTDNDDGVFDPADTTGRDKWTKVFGDRKLFAFTADEPVDSIPDELADEFVRSHTFFVRAVDNEGLPSVKPAHRSFTAMTLSPTVNVTRPPATGSITPTVFPPIATFRWVAEDYVDDLLTTLVPDSVSWILEPITSHNISYDETLEYIRNLPVDSPEWDARGGWKWYGNPDGTGKSWTTPPLNTEPFLFVIRAKDEAGAITPVFDPASNVRRVHILEIDGGPKLTVWNEYLGSVTTASCGGMVITTSLAGVEMEFCWEATAEHYGGTVVAYRYGWDIDDLSDPEQWETDYIPFTGPDACAPARVFYYATHTFAVEVIDESGYCSRIEIKINFVQPTMEYNLLVIDDYPEGTQVGWDDPVAPGRMPSDAQHDQFWLDVLADVDGFTPQDVLSVRLGDWIPLGTLARYKSVVWNSYARVEHPALSVLHEYIKFRPGLPYYTQFRPNILALYLAAGGHVLICGEHPVSQSIDPNVLIGSFRFPIIFLYELGGDQTTVPGATTERVGLESFAYRDLCLETMDFAYTTPQRRRGSALNCPVDQVRTLPPDALRTHTMRAAEPIDPDFPYLELRPEAAAPGRWYHEDKQGLDVEVYNPQYFADLCATVPGSGRGCFQPIYALDCLDTGEPTYGAPVAFWTSAWADRVADAPGAVAARSAVFGFPPVYFWPDEVREAIEAIVFEEWELPRK